MKISSAENFMRSAIAPMISAGVMMAKVIWKHMKTNSGMVPCRLSLPMPASSALLEAADVGADSSPPSVKASE